VRQAGEKLGEATAARQRAASQLFIELLATPRLMLEILSMRCVENASYRACGFRGQLGKTLADLSDFQLKLGQFHYGRGWHSVQLDAAHCQTDALGACVTVLEGIRHRSGGVLVKQIAQSLLLRMRALPLEGSAAYIGNR
jgi:hypothetical protein